jgi:hypothetical protein
MNANGFWVKENESGTGNIDFSWIAIAPRKGFEQITIAPELLNKDFDVKMNNVMFNENNKTDLPQSIWWDGQNIRFDKPPVKKLIQIISPQ